MGIGGFEDPPVSRCPFTISGLRSIFWFGLTNLKPKVSVRCTATVYEITGSVPDSEAFVPNSDQNRISDFLLQNPNRSGLKLFDSFWENSGFFLFCVSSIKIKFSGF